MNTLSAFHVLEQLSAPSFPVVLPRISVIGLFVREELDPETLQLQLKVVSGAQEVFDGPVTASFQQQPVARIILEMHGLVIPGPGDLSFLITDGDSPLCSWVVAVNHIGNPDMQQLHFPGAIPIQ